MGDGGYGWRYQIAADGAGMVWFLGPWQLIRLDPSSGDVTAWDAEDDRRFAAPEARLAAATGPGVWMLDGGRVRLFDGKQFRVDEQLPADMLNVPGGPRTDGFVYDLVQAGGDLWVSVVDSVESEEGGPDPRSGSQVVRFADDVWTVMSQPEDRVGGYLTVDSEGTVWDGGQMWSDAVGSLDIGSGANVKRWDGLPGRPRAVRPPRTRVGRWWPTRPAACGCWSPGPGGPNGCATSTEPRGDRWAWTRRPAVGIDWEPGTRGLAVDEDGWAWLPGARVSHSGQVERLDGKGFNAIAAPGDRIVALDSEQALLWTDDGFVPVTHRPGTADWFFSERPWGTRSRLTRSGSTPRTPGTGCGTGCGKTPAPGRAAWPGPPTGPVDNRPGRLGRIPRRWPALPDHHGGLPGGHRQARAVRVRGLHVRRSRWLGLGDPGR